MFIVGRGNPAGRYTSLKIDTLLCIVKVSMRRYGIVPVVWYVLGLNTAVQSPTVQRIGNGVKVSTLCV